MILLFLGESTLGVPNPAAPDGNMIDILQHDLDTRSEGITADHKRALDETEYLVEEVFTVTTAGWDPATSLPKRRTTTAIDPYASPASQLLSKRQIDWHKWCHIWPQLSFCPVTSMVVNSTAPG